MSRDRTRAVDGLKLDKKLTCLGECRRRRWIEPAKLSGIGDAPKRQFEGERREIRLQDLRPVRCGKKDFFALAPKPVAHARPQTARSPPALVGRRLGDPHRLQSRHPCPGRKARDAHQPGVDDYFDPRDGQARLRNRGREHHFSRAGWTWGDRKVLSLVGEAAVQWNDAHITGCKVGEAVADTPDLPRSRKKDQDVAVRLGEGLPYRLLNCPLDSPSLRPRR